MTLLLIPGTAAQVYRDDLDGRTAESAFSDEDGNWIAIASMFASAASLEPGDRVRSRIMRSAIKLANEVLGPKAVRRGHRTDPKGTPRSPATLVRMLAEEAEHAGALRSAAALLDRYAEAETQLAALHRGRLAAHRARVAWKMGDLDGAAAAYRSVESLGRRTRTDELLVRSWIGYGNIAQLRGNYPAVRRWMQRASRLAERRGFDALAGWARQAMMVAAATSGDFNAALRLAVTTLRLVEGDALAEIDLLGNLGQLMLVAGFPTEAFGAFVAVLRKELSARTALPVLGGLALAAGQLRDMATLEWAVKETQRIGGASHLPYHHAMALFECARALEDAGDWPRSRRLLGKAARIAEEHSYHELRVRTEELLEQPPPAAAPVPHVVPRVTGAAIKYISSRFSYSVPERVLLAAA